MRTVVINTCKEEQTLRLDLLFRIPFDEDHLIWLNEPLSAPESCMEAVYSRLITDVHLVDRNLNLIVVADQSSFPMGGYRPVAEVYSKLLVAYVQKRLIEPMAERSLMVKSAMLLLIDNAVSDLPYGFFPDSGADAEDALASDDQDLQLAAENERETLETELAALKKRSDKEELDRDILVNDAGRLVDPDEFEILETLNREDPKNPDYLFRRIIKKIFGWKDDSPANQLNWSIRINDETEIIGFEDVFPDVIDECKHAKAQINTCKLAVDGVFQALTGPAAERGKDRILLLYPLHRNPDSDPSLTYFHALYCVYCCVESGTLHLVDPIPDAEVRLLIAKAYAKYTYYSQEQHIPVQFTSLENPKDMDVLERFSEAPFSLPEQPVFKDPLIKKAFLPKEEQQLSEDLSLAEGSLDERFFRCAEIISEEYNREKIEAQNTEVLMLCMNQYLAWRDSKTADLLKQTLDLAAEDSQQGETGSLSEMSGRFELVKKKYEAMHNEDIERIAAVDNEPADYDDVCHEVDVLCAKYDHLQKKGKKYKLALFGGLASVAVMFFAYVVFVGVSNWEGLVRLPMLAGTFGALCAAYLASCVYYTRKIRKQKVVLLDEIMKMKQLSEERRLESLIALKEYYESVMTQAETHALWWLVVAERYRRNLVLGKLRNEHLKLFHDLQKATLGFATKLKIDINRQAAYQEEFTGFDVERSYFEAPNLSYYSFFEQTAPKQTDDRDEEGSDT